MSPLRPPARRPPARPAGRGRGETPRVRGERTRARVADALIALLAEGDPTPTAKMVAGRAGVSVRLVFHHFEDMEALYAMVLEVQAARHWDPVAPPGPDGARAERIAATVQQRGRLFEAVGPVRRSSVVLTSDREAITGALRAGETLQRRWLEQTFAPELDAAGRTHRDLLEALQAAASFETWDRLRRGQRQSVAATRRIMARLLEGALAT